MVLLEDVEQMGKELYIKLIHCGNRNLTNSNDSANKNVFYMPVGLFAIADVLKKNGCNIEMIHSDLEAYYDLEKVLDFEKLDIVGFDCHWVNQSYSVIETARRIKEIKPSVFIFVGGYTASFYSKEIMQDYPQIDAVVRGDGELPVAQLCSTLAKGEQAFNNVQNLIWRNTKGQVIENEFSYIGSCVNMEQLDYAAVELLRNWELYRDFSKYWTHFKPLGSVPMFILAIGRGCRYSCTYCGGSCKAQKEINNRQHVEIRSVESALGTIRKAYSFGFECFYSGYEFLNSDEWYILLLRRIKQENINIDFVYGSYSLPSKSIVDALAEGMRNVVIEISPETFNEVLRKKNKDARLFYDNAQLEECLDYISTKMNIKVQLYFGYFLPFDTEKSIMDTIAYILKLLKKYPGMIEIEYSHFSTDPASMIYLKPKEYDVEICVQSFSDYIEFIKRKYITEKSTETDMRIFFPKRMSELEREVMGQRIRFMNFIYSRFRSSIAYIMYHTEKNEWLKEVIYRYEETMDCGSFSSEKTMELMISVLNNENITSMGILNRIIDEYEEQKKQTNLFGAGPSLWNETNIIESKNRCISDAAQGELAIEFDF